MSQTATWRKSIPVRENSPCKADGQSMHFRSNKETFDWNRVSKGKVEIDMLME